MFEGNKSLFNWFYTNVNQMMKLTGEPYSVKNNKIHFVPTKGSEWFSILTMVLKPVKFDGANFNLTLNGKDLFDSFKTAKKLITTVVTTDEDFQINLEQEVENDDVEEPEIEKQTFTIDLEDLSHRNKLELWRSYGISETLPKTAVKLTKELIDRINERTLPVINVKGDKAFLSSEYTKDCDYRIRVDKKFLLKFPPKSVSHIDGSNLQEGKRIVSIYTTAPHIDMIQSFKTVDF